MDDHALTNSGRARGRRIDKNNPSGERGGDLWTGPGPTLFKTATGRNKAGAVFFIAARLTERSQDLRQRLFEQADICGQSG